MSGIEAEGMTFVQAVLAGMIVYSSYTCIRKFRRIIKHNLTAIAIEDMAFWLGTAIYLFVQIYYTSDGSIRWFFVLGVVIGAGLAVLSANIFIKVHKKIVRKKKN